MIGWLGDRIAKKTTEITVEGFSSVRGARDGGMDLRFLGRGRLWAGALRLLQGVAGNRFGRFDGSTCTEGDGACRLCNQGGNFFAP